MFPIMMENNSDPEQIVKEKNLVQISDTSEIEAIIQKIIDANPDQVEEYRSGKEKVFGFFVGQVMKESKGKANPKLVNEILRKCYHRSAEFILRIINKFKEITD
ncbi:MAG: hypothetical protein MZV64_21860 [Ignavibacteriales bacterium]|nr:hypothetical protein [Ignavibacteriales bacterium]